MFKDHVSAYDISNHYQTVPRHAVGYADVPRRPLMRAKIALAFGALVVALLVAECAVRVAKLAPEVAVLDLGRYRLSANPAIGYEPVPGVTFED